MRVYLVDFEASLGSSSHSPWGDYAERVSTNMLSSPLLLPPKEDCRDTPKRLIFLFGRNNINQRCRQILQSYPKDRPLGLGTRERVSTCTFRAVFPEMVQRGTLSCRDADRVYTLECRPPKKKYHGPSKAMNCDSFISKAGQVS